MANKPLKSITFPGLSDTYTFAQIDNTLTAAGKAADAKKVGDELTDVKADLSNAKSMFVEMYPISVANNYRLNNANGLRTSNSNYQLLKYAVSEGDTIKVKSDDRFQFQNAIGVPATNPSNRVGETYEVYDDVITVPTGATHLILSTPKTGSTAKVCTVEDMADAIGNVSSLYDYTDKTLFENSMWNRTTGLSTATISWCRTSDYLSDDIIRVYTTSQTLTLYLLAWDAEDEYVGMWTSETWSKSNSSSTNKQYDLAEFRKAFPDYKFKLNIQTTKPQAEGGICVDAIYKDIILVKERSIVEKLSDQDQKIDGFSDVAETEFTSDTIWISGTYASDTGSFDSTKKWMHTPKGSIDDLLSVTNADSTLLMFMMAFDSEDTYLGYYTDGGFVKVFNAGNARTSWDLLAARRKYPSYTFIIVVRGVTISDITPSEKSEYFTFTASTPLRYAIEDVANDQIKDSIDEAVEEIKGSTAVTNKIRLCEWNIGHFAGGGNTQSAITSAEYEAKKLAYRQYLNGIKADIIGVSEYSAIFCVPESATTKDDIFGNYKSQYEGTQIRYSCNALFGDIAINNPTKYDYECNQSASTSQPGIETTDYYYVESTIELGSDTVTLVMTHCAFDSQNPQVAADQYDELIAKYANAAKVIIMGDLNANTPDLLDVFGEAGYMGANNDWLGALTTYPSGSKPLDCIYAKGVQIANIEVYSTNLSDHYAIACDIIA